MRLAPLLATAFAVLSAGCQPPASSPPAVAADAALLGDTSARLISLRNRLQADPYSADARLGLGLLWLELGNPRSAEAELTRAVELGMDANLSVPPLARSLNLLGRSKEVVELNARVKLTRPEAAAELMAELAEAHVKTGSPQLARQVIASALAADAGSAGALLVRAKMELADAEVDQALRTIERALAGNGRRADAHELQGDVLLLVKADVPAGRAAYERAVAAGPRQLTARAKLVMLAIDRKELTEARERLGQLERIAPGSPPALYLAAKLALTTADLTAARNHITRALTEYPKDLRSLLLAAEIEVKAGSLAAAEEHLANALTLAPTLPRVRHLLAQTYLRAGAPEKAEMILEPLVRAKPPDPGALGLSAEAALQAGQTMRSMRLFESAAAAQPGNARYRTAVALNRIARGDAGGGFAELEALAIADPSILGDLALLAARLQQGDPSAAEKAAERLALKQPDRALPQLILGRLRLRAQDTDGARKRFERAVELDPAFVPAAMGLADLDLRRGAVAEARTQIERVLKAAPNSLEAMLAMVDIRKRSGESAERVTASLEAVAAAHPAQVRPQLLLINHLIVSGAINPALLAAQTASARFPNDLNILDALGRAQVAAGESAQALSTFRRIVSARPRSAEPLLRLADVYAARNEIESAIEHYQQALRLRPDLTQARIRLVGYHTVKKNWRDALYGALDVQKRLPKDGVGFQLEGLVHAAQNQWEPAITAFKAALQRGPSSEAATHLHKAYGVSGRNADAARFAADWVKSHPRDNQFIGYLGEAAVRRGDFAAAEAHFRAILKNDAKDSRALNNLAWVLLRQGRAGAVELARQASALDPYNVNVMDTLASALAAEGRDSEALELHKKAVLAAPKAAHLRLNLARQAIKVKDFALARVHLDMLSAMGKEFPAQSEVWALRQQLR